MNTKHHLRTPPSPSRSTSPSSSSSRSTIQTGLTSHRPSSPPLSRPRGTTLEDLFPDSGSDSGLPAFPSFTSKQQQQQQQAEKAEKAEKEKKDRQETLTIIHHLQQQMQQELEKLRQQHRQQREKEEREQSLALLQRIETRLAVPPVWVRVLEWVVWLVGVEGVCSTSSSTSSSEVKVKPYAKSATGTTKAGNRTCTCGYHSTGTCVLTTLGTAVTTTVSSTSSLAVRVWNSDWTPCSLLATLLQCVLLLLTLRVIILPLLTLPLPVLLSHVSSAWRVVRECWVMEWRIERTVNRMFGCALVMAGFGAFLATVALSVAVVTCVVVELWGMRANK